MLILSRIAAVLLFFVSPAFSDGIINGGSGGGGSGTINSISAGIGATVGGTACTGPACTIQAINTPSVRTSGNYATTDGGNTIYYNSASNQSPTLPLAATAGNGFFFATCSIQAAQTITASGSDTIGATGVATTYSLGTGTAIAPTCVQFQSNGASTWTPTPYGGGGTPGGSNTQLQYNNSSAFGGVSGWTTNGSTTLTGTKLAVSVAASAAAWTTNGIRYANAAVTYTDTSSSGTVAAAYTDLFGASTIVASSATTYTNYYGTYFQNPVAGTNVTMTNLLAIGADSIGLPGTGTNTAPLINFLAAGAGNQLGFYYGGSNNVVLTSQGVPSVSLSFTSIGVSKLANFCWSSNQFNVAGCDTYFTRGASAAIVQQGQADAASPVAQTLQVQNVVAGTSNTAGVNWTLIGSRGTGTGPSGNIIIEVGKTGTTGTTQNSAFPMLSVNAGNATGATIQLGDGTNFTTYDSCTALTTGATGIVACTASAMRFKNPMIADVRDDISELHPAVWTYKDPERFGEGEFVGLYADDVEKMDRRCVVYDHGLLKDYRDRCVIAHLVAVVQKQQSEIEQLRAR